MNTPDELSSGSSRRGSCVLPWRCPWPLRQTEPQPWSPPADHPAGPRRPHGWQRSGPQPFRSQARVARVGSPVHRSMCRPAPWWSTARVPTTPPCTNASIRCGRPRDRDRRLSAVDVSDHLRELGPVAADLRPTYDQSVALAVAHNLATMEGLVGRPRQAPPGLQRVLGAPTPWATPRSRRTPKALDPASTQVVLLSDPRGPWGVKQWASDHFPGGHHGLPHRDNAQRRPQPADTGDELQVTSVIIDGDPSPTSSGCGTGRSPR